MTNTQPLELLSREESRSLDQRYEAWPTVEEAARRLNVTTRTIERMIKEGILDSLPKPMPRRRPLTLVNPAAIEAEQAKRLKAMVIPSVIDTEKATAQLDVIAQVPELVREVLEVFRPTHRDYALKITLADAVHISGLPYKLLRRAINKGDLHAWRFDGQVWLHRKDLEEFRPPASPLKKRAAVGARVQTRGNESCASA